MIAKIKIPLYKTFVKVYTSRKKYERDSLPLGAKPLRPCTLATTGLINTANGGQYFMILIPVGSKAGVIAHEALHIVSFIWSERGVIFDVNNDEPAAYLLEFLVDAITNCLPKRK